MVIHDNKSNAISEFPLVDDIRVLPVEIKKSVPVTIDGGLETGLATSTKQDTQITLETTLNSLTDTLQEATQRLSTLAGAMSAGAVGLRVVGVTMPSTAVTGPITSAQSIAEKNVAGISYTQRVALENLTAVISNVNNCVGV